MKSPIPRNPFAPLVKENGAVGQVALLQLQGRDDSVLLGSVQASFQRNQSTSYKPILTKKGKMLLPKDYTYFTFYLFLPLSVEF